MKQKKLNYLCILLAFTLSSLFLCLIMQTNLLSIAGTFVSTTVFIYPLSCLSLLIIFDCYGLKTVITAIISILIAIFFFSLSVSIASGLTPPLFGEQAHQAFSTAMLPVTIFPTIINTIAIIAALTAYFFVFDFLGRKNIVKHFSIKSIISGIFCHSITIIVALSLMFSLKVTMPHEVFLASRNELIVMFFLTIILAYPFSLLSKFIKETT